MDTIIRWALAISGGVLITLISLIMIQYVSHLAAAV